MANGDDGKVKNKSWQDVGSGKYRHAAKEAIAAQEDVPVYEETTDATAAPTDTTEPLPPDERTSTEDKSAWELDLQTVEPEGIYDWYLKDHPEEEAAQRQQIAEERGYDATFWQDPQRVARWHNAIKAAPPGATLPEWMTPDFVQQVEQAYKYFEFRNNGESWTNWKYLNPADQALPLLAGMNVPPPEFLWPGEEKFVQGQGTNLDAVMAGQAAWGALPEDQRKAILSAPDFNITQYDPMVRQQMLADPLFNWDALPAWQQSFYKLTSNPYIMSSPMALAGMQAGRFAGPVGQGFGAIIGYGLGVVGGQQYDPTKGVWEQPSVVAGLMKVLNGLSEGTEQAAGYAGQVIDAGLAGMNGNVQAAAAANAMLFDPVTRQAAWEAGRITYEYGDLGGRLFTNLLQMSEQFKVWDDVVKAFASGDSAKAADLAAAFINSTPLAQSGEDFILGYAQPVDKAAAMGTSPITGKEIKVTDVMGVLQSARHDIEAAIRAGQDPDAVILQYMNEAAQFVGGQVQDLAIQSTADPLNVLPEIGGAVTAGLLEKAAGGRVDLGVEPRGPYDVIKDFSAQVKTKIPVENLNELGGVSRWLAGVNEKGEITAGFMGLYPSETLTSTKIDTSKQVGLFGAGAGREWFRHIATLTPEARARTAISMAMDNLGTILNTLDVSEIEPFFTALSKSDMGAMKELAGNVVGSAEFYTVLPMLQGWNKLGELAGMWEMSAENRGLLSRLSDILGMEPARLVEDLGRRDGAARVWEQVRSFVEKSSDPAAKTLLEDMTAGRFTVEDLQAIGKTFNGADALPWHPGAYKAMVMDSLGEHAAEWSKGYFGLKPDSGALRLAHTLKGAQSLLLLGFNPGYLINNTVNNVATRASSGVFGFMTPNQMKDWTTRFGITPERMREGVGMGGETVKGMSKADAVLADAMKGKGALAAADNIVRSVNDKVGVFANASKKMEGFESAQAYTIGMQKGWYRFWKRGSGFRPMDAGMVKMLRDIDPSLPDLVYRAIEGGMNQKEIEARLAGTAGAMRAQDLVTGAAKQLNMTTSQAMTLLNQAGVLTALESYLKNATTLDKVDAAFHAVDARAQDWIDIVSGNEARNNAQHVSTRIKGEGAHAVFEVVLNTFEKINDRWIDHYMEAGDVAAQMEAIDPAFQGQIALLWGDWRRRSISEWTRTNNHALTVWKGVIDGLGLKTPEAQRIVSVLGEQFKAWNDAYEFAQKQYDAYYETWKGKFSDRNSIDARMVEMESMKKRIDAEFQKAFEIERNKQEQFRDLLADQMGLGFGDDAKQATVQAYQQVIDFRAEMVKALQKFRKEVENLYGADRRAAKAKFYQDTYLPRIVEMRRVYEDGIGRVQKVVTGRGGPDVGEAGAPVGPKTPPPAPPRGGEGGVAAPIPQPLPDTGRGATPAVATTAENVWKVAGEAGITGLDEFGQPVFGAKLEVIKFVKKWGGTEGAHIKTFADITPELMRKAVDSKKAWEAAQDALPKIGDDAEALKTESEGLAAPKESANEASEKAMAKVTPPAADAAPSPNASAFGEGNRGLLDNPTYKKAINGHIADVDPMAREALQYELSVMRSQVADGEAGQRLFSKGEGFIGATASSYPDWYGPMRTKKADVLFALDALTKGLDKPDQALYRNLKGIAAALLFDDPAISEKWDWAKAWGAEDDILFRLDRRVANVVDEALKAAAEGNAPKMDLMFRQFIDLIAETPKEIQSEFVKVLDADGKRVATDETYSQYFDRMYDELARLNEAGTAEMLNAQAELALADQKATAEMKMTRELLREKLTEAVPNATPEQVDMTLALLDARAEAWAKATKSTPEEWYASRVADVARGGEVDLMQGSYRRADLYHVDNVRKWYRETAKRTDWVDAAKKEFGLTTDFREAGWILPDGKMLDFSGKREGGQPFNRAMDHRDIARVTERGVEGSSAMVEFASQTGSVRFSVVGTEVYIDLMNTVPTDAQIKAMKRAVSGYEGITWDIDDARGNVLLSGDLPARTGSIDRIVGDAKRVFEGTESGQDLEAHYATLFQSGMSPVWYSRLTQTIEGIQQPRMSAEQLRGMLQKAGVKADELKWTGFDEFVSGKKTVTKEEALNYLRENMVQVEEVTKGSAGYDAIKRADALRAEAGKKLVDAGLEESEAYKIARDIQDGNDSQYAGNGRLGEILGDLWNDLADAGEEARGERTTNPATKFSQYVLPGGENYREVLFTLPYLDSKAIDTTGWRVETRGEYLNNERLIAVYDAQGNEVGVRGGFTGTDADAIKEFGLWKQSEDAKKYTSPHWSESNVLAHTRLTDRVDADGKRVLFVEEVQSDWHQAGREQGYKLSDQERAKLEARLKPLEEKFNQLWKQMEESLPADATGDDIYGNIKQLDPRLVEEMASLQDRINSSITAVPDAPFAKTWHELVMKRVLRMAAEDGYDRVAWTNGEQQAARYDLSKQVDAIEYTKFKDGRIEIDAVKDDNSLLNQTVNSPEELTGIIGKEAAQKIVDATYPINREGNVIGSLRGEQLAVGGQGMKGFYDQILPAWMDKYAKKWGAKTGETRIEAGREDLWGDVIKIGKGDPIFASVHSVDVTPAMKESVLRGQPLFQEAKGGVTFLEDGRAVIHAFEGADISTIVHEVGHIFRRDLSGSDLRAAEEWAGVKDGVWTREAEEKFARGFEKYLADGSAPSKVLKAVFAKLKDWLVGVYRVIAGSPIDVNLTPEIKGVFDRLLAENPLYRVEVDQTKRMEALAETTGTDFFAEMKRKAAELKAQKEAGQAVKKSAAEVAANQEAISARSREVDRLRAEREAAAANSPLGIDQSQKAADVAEIAETDFFRQLKVERERIMAQRAGTPPAAEAAPSPNAGAFGEGSAAVPAGMTYSIGDIVKMGDGTQATVTEVRADGTLALDNGRVVTSASVNRVAAQDNMFGDFGMKSRPDAVQSSMLFQRAEPTESKAFKAWFGESKVVDENGRPLVVYRGERKGDTFEIFDPKQTETGAFFFTNKRDAAMGYIHENAKTPREFYIKMENMLDLSDPRLPVKNPEAKRFVDEWGKKWKRWKDELSGEEVTPWEALQNGDMWNAFPTRWADLQKAIKKAGYDGAKLPDSDGGLWIQFDSYIVFDPKNIKSVNNRGTWDAKSPNILFQSADPRMPLGGIDQAAGFVPEGAILDETYAASIKPLLEAMKAEARKQSGQKKFNFAQLPPEAQAQLSSYVKKVVRQDMPSAKLATVRYGESLRDFALLNYNKKYGFDKYILDPTVPYQFWSTRTGMNTLVRLLDRPAMFATLFRTMRFMSQYERDLPDRLKGKMKVEVPGLPEWMGGSVYIDPLKQMFPILNFLQPFEQMQKDKNAQVMEAERVLQEWAGAEKYSQAEINQAVQTRSGSVWEAALAEASIRRKAEISNPMDFMSTILGPAWYLTTPYKLAMGQGKEISQLPITRTAQAVQTATAGTWAEGFGNAVGLLAKPEEWWREKNGLPQYGEYGEYYIDRQIANLVAEGLVTPDQAKMAMIERSGDVYAMAEERVRQELMMRVPGASALYAGLHGGIDDMLKAMPTSLFGAGILPEGELKYRGLKEKWNAAWDAYDAGDKEAIGRFFDDHPEYEVYLMKGQTPDERLRNVLTAQIWDSYMGMDKATRKIVTAQLGPLFQHSFLNSETRSPESLDVETLARWSLMLGNDVPETSATEQVVNAPQYAQPQLEGLPTATSAAMAQYDMQKGQMFPMIGDIQNLYYASSDADRAQILTIYPQLREYWDWRRTYIEAHPEAAPFLDRDVAKGILSGELDARDYGMSQDQAERLITYYNTEFQTPVYTADYYLKNASPYLLESLSTHQLTGDPLTEGAYKELELIWQAFGSPGESFTDWLENVIYATIGY